MEGCGVSCSRVFPRAFSAQGTLCALRPIMGFELWLDFLCGGAGQRGADLYPPDTTAHDGPRRQLPGAARYVRGKGARCVR
jgi:hypothetical protein